MPQEDIKKFYLAVTQDPAMKQQILTAPDRPSLVSTAVKLGNEKGYSFTEPEVESWLTTSENQSRPDGLSDTDLESIAGGKGFDEAASAAATGGVAAIPAVGPFAAVPIGVLCVLPKDRVDYSTSVTAAAISCN